MDGLVGRIFDYSLYSSDDFVFRNEIRRGHSRTGRGGGSEPNYASLYAGTGSTDITPAYTRGILAEGSNAPTFPGQKSATPQPRRGSSAL